MKTREANPYFGVKLLRVECPTRDLPPAGSSWEITSSLSSSWLWLSPTCLLMGGTPGNSGSTADHLVKLRWTFTVHKALCMALFRTSWFVHCFLLPGRVVSTPNIWIPLFLLYMVQFIKWSYLSCLERIRASPLTEVFVNVAFPGRSSLMPSGGARPPWSLHLSPTLLYFLAPATSCDHGPRPCVSVFTVTFLLLRCQLHGTSSLLSTAVCFAPGIQQVLNTCYPSTP